ncbi:MAG: hypothetical protein NUW21_06220 [Elusimicrobia bacterium]|nr:hypothetical protein [Elusimicrobiota bacterium]
MRRLILAALLAACSRAPEPDPGTGAYEAPGFAAQAPAAWRVQESDGGSHRASFFGPPEGPAPFSEAIVVYRHGPASSVPTMEAFIAAKSLEGPPSLPAKTTVAGKAALDLRYASVLAGPHFPEGRVPMLHHAVLVADGDGYWALVHSWPEKGMPSEGVFKTFVDTFRPAPAR